MHRRVLRLCEEIQCGCLLDDPSGSRGPDLRNFANPSGPNRGPLPAQALRYSGQCSPDEMASRPTANSFHRPQLRHAQRCVDRQTSANRFLSVLERSGCFRYG
jgi:hypothetical protein